MSLSTSRIAVFSSSVGVNDYMAVKPLAISKDCLDMATYYWVSNQRPISDSWHWIDIPRPWSALKCHTDRRTAKVPKILPELLAPGYDIYVWCDDTHLPTSQLFSFLNENIKYDYYLFSHPHRHSVISEAREVLSNQKNLNSLVNAQMNQYSLDGFLGTSHDRCLYELAGFAKRRNSRTLRTSLMWWEQICKYSSRDQLSLPYILWKNEDIRIYNLPGFVSGSLHGNIFIPQIRYKHV